MRRHRRWVTGGGLLFVMLLAGPVWLLATERVAGVGHWAEASRAPAGLAPTPV
ncbi:hypothetical protein [Halomonas maura]|uniref:hypothetical protein n=1 Tax=Halomonas maura TaxID=117606 RepID=UPI00338FBE22